MQTKKVIQYLSYEFNILLYVNRDGTIKNDIAFLGIRTKPSLGKYKENGKERDKIYYRNNKEKILKYHKEYNKEYYIKNKDRILEVCRKYKQTPNGKKIKRKCNANRRELGYNPMNEWFSGCEGHHLNKEDVIYIPSSLHRSVSHSVIRDRNMKEINDVAFEWLCTQESL